jgi:hypothetical protein
MKQPLLNLAGALALAAAAAPALAQTGPGVGIGTTAPDASAALDIVSSDKGALLPRLSEAARLAMGTGTVPAPATGLLVYQTDGASPGFYYASSPTTWTRLTDGTTADGRYIQNQTAADQPANFRISGTGTLGALGVGTSAPGSTLDVRGTANLSNAAGAFHLYNFPAAYNTVLMGDFVGAGNNGPQLRFSGSGAAGTFMDIGQSGTGDFVVEGNDNPRLTVLNGGRVGIGTSTPGALLDVQGGADSNGGGDPGALAFSYRNGGFRHFLRSRHNSGLGGGGNDLDIYLNNSATVEGSSAAGTGNVQVLTLENNNGQARMGIGTTAPGGRLHLVNDGGGGNQPDDYLIDEYGVGDQGIYLRKAGGTAAAPTPLTSGDFIGQLTFVPQISAGLGYSGSSLTSHYQGNGTTLSTDLRLLTSGTEHLRLLPTGALWQLGTSNNILLTTGSTTAPTGGGNVVLGNAVGGALTSGYQNVLLGQSAGNHLTTGYNNVLLGNGPGDALTTGGDNVLIGASAGSGTTGSANIMIGGGTGVDAGAAERNVLVGYASGNHTTGNDNTLVGFSAGVNTSSGTNNTALGKSAGYDNSSGSYNTFLGADTNADASNLTNATAVGAGARVSQSNTVVLGNNASVGIGTGAPLTRLSISPGTTEPKITLWDGNSPTTHYGFGVSGSQLNYHVDLPGSSHVFSAGGKNGDGTELMRVRGDGRVGIGTSNPFGQLANTSGNTVGSDNQGGNPGSLNWAASQQGYVGQIYNGGTDPNSDGLVVKVNGANPNAVVLDLSKGAQNDTGPSLLTVRASGNVNLSTLTGTGTRLVTADANGNLGSGTPASLDATTASNGLGLSGTDVRLGGALTQATTISGITSANGLELTGTAAPRITNTTAASSASTRVLGLRGEYDGAIAGSGTHLSFLSASGNEVGRIASTQDAGSFKVGLSFSTSNGTGNVVTERMRISPAGNVGIGTDPAAKLDVNGNTKLGTNGTAFNAIIRAAVTQTVGAIPATSAVTVTFTIANVTTGGTAYVSPSGDLANGISISYARTGNGQVVAKFYNATGGSVTVSSNTYNITVVQ